MLTHLHLENFKSFLNLDLPLRPLTMLSGLNGMGKSTVLQALLLLRQSGRQEFSSRTDVNLSDIRGNSVYRLVLNGRFVQLGNPTDVLSRSGGDELTIAISYSTQPTDDGIGGFEAAYEDTQTFPYRLDRASNALVTDDAHFPYDLDLYIPLGDMNLVQYLQAERLGPRTLFETTELMNENYRSLGTRGEYTAHFLNYWSLRADTPLVVQEGIRHGSSSSSNLNSQVMAWMGEISPGTKIETQPIEGTDLIRLRFGFGDSDYFRPTNVGFGLTYTLPVVTALVAAQRDDLILLENPEAHLHPRGQSKIGELMARAASAGAQVIFETHSDHILNGIRIAARKGVIPAADVALHFFQRENGSAFSSTVVSPKLSDNGRLDFWPDGFFDEWDNSLDALM